MSSTPADAAAPPTEAHPAKLGVRQYVGYAAGDASNNLTFSMVSAFVLIYYTDVAGIPAAVAGTLLLVVRVWGGFTDLLAGRLADITTPASAASGPTCCSARYR